MKAIITFFALLILTAGAFAQERPAADPADVASIDSIMKATYDVISGDAGQARDWNRFRSLFFKDARLIPTGKDKAGNIRISSISPEDYIKSSSSFFEKDGFFERETARTVEQFGNIAHVFSTYEAYRKKDDKKPFMRGINSFQLVNDGKRWYVLTIFWQAENDSLTIPKKYLKDRN